MSQSFYGGRHIALLVPFCFGLLAFLFLGPLLISGIYSLVRLYCFLFQPQITDRIEMDADWNPVLKKRGISVLLAAPAAYSNGR